MSTDRPLATIVWSRVGHTQQGALLALPSQVSHRDALFLLGKTTPLITS